MFRPFLYPMRILAVVLLSTFAFHSMARSQGIYLSGVGPVNRGMGGAGTAAPLDAIGALYWNPGSISALPCNEVGFGMELMLVDVSLSTNVGGATSQTDGEAGVSPIPSIGWVHHMEDSPWTVGLGLYGIAGFKNNLPGNPANPLLGGAPAYASAEILQIAPTLAYTVTESLSIGFSPLVTAGTLTLDPLGPSVVVPVPTPGQGNRLAWGGGFQVGVYYIPQDDWHFGCTYKSQQWLEDFRFFTPAGVVQFDLDMPSIITMGLAYSGLENWVLAMDARYYDYSNTPGFDVLGWRSSFAGAVGVQYHMTERTHVRLGYNFNQNPIQSGDVLTNILDPLIQDHNISTGFSYRFASNVDINAAYVYLVNNSVTGPLPSPPFPAGSTVTNSINAHSAVLGVTVRY